MNRSSLRLADRVCAWSGLAFRVWAVLAALLVGQAAAQGVPPGTDPGRDPEQLLQAIRNALLDAATDAPTRVVSSAWIDERGALQESAQWHSQLRVRGVRVLSYLGTEGDDPSARPRWKVQPFFDAATRPGAVASQECLDAARHWRMPVRFEAVVEARVHGPQAAVAALLAQQARQWWARHGAVLPRWYAQDAWPAAGLPVGTSGALPSPPSAYQQALFGIAPLPPSARLRLTLSVGVPPRNSVRENLGPPPGLSIPSGGGLGADRPGGDAPSAAADAMPSVLMAGLDFEDDTGRVLWRLVQGLPEAPREAFAGAAALAALEQVLQKWQATLASLAPCDFPRFEARPTGPSQWVLPVGPPAGFVPGQRVFIADRNRLPERILEPEALGQTVLAEVVSVSAKEVTLRQIAGPVLGAGPRWVAWPL